MSVEKLLSAEQCADFAALEAAAVAEMEKPAAEVKAEAAAVEATGAQAATDAEMLLKIARPLLEKIFPACSGAGDAAWDCLQEPMAELFAHYGLSLGDALNNPWAKLGLAAVPLGYHIWDKAQQAAPKAVAAPDFSAPAPEAAPGSKSVIIGAPIPDAEAEAGG